MSPPRLARLRQVFRSARAGLFGPQAPPLAAPGPLKDAQPLFVVGCPRSGTTLLARLLNAHPAVLVTNETSVFYMLDHVIKGSRRGIAAGMLYGKEYNELWADHLQAQARGLVESYYARIAAAEHKTGLRYWGDKHPHYSDCLDFLAGLYPGARYIYIVRDPRDSASSIAAMIASDFRKALAIWKRMSEKYEVFWPSVPAKRRITLRYEDLVADYEAQARRLFAWLALPYAADVQHFLTSARSLDAHAPPGTRTAAVDYRAQSVGRWRRELSAEQREWACEQVGAFMARYGYEA